MTQTVIAYYKNGNQKYEFTLEDRVMTGVYREWWSNGKPRYLIDYISNGHSSIRHGRFIAYDDLGRIKQERKYENGVRIW